MEINALPFQVHPLAKEILFEHYRACLKIFGDVLGLLEVDYLAITIISPENELLFFSSEPQVDYMIIEEGLWHLDLCYQAPFFQRHQPESWETLYPRDNNNRLRYFKQELHSYSTGVTIPALFNEYRVLYSFALVSHDTTIQRLFHQNTQKLMRMGQYCLLNIMNTVSLPNARAIHENRKSQFKLIVNSRVSDE